MTHDWDLPRPEVESRTHRLPRAVQDIILGVALEEPEHKKYTHARPENNTSANKTPPEKKTPKQTHTHNTARLRAEKQNGTMAQTNITRQQTRALSTEHRPCIGTWCKTSTPDTDALLAVPLPHFHAPSTTRLVSQNNFPILACLSSPPSCRPARAPI